MPPRAQRAVVAAPAEGDAEPPTSPAEAIAWRVVSGVPDAPTYPNALAWSAHDELAIPCSRKVFVLQARGPPADRGYIRAESMLAGDEDHAPTLSSTHWGRAAKPRPDDTAGPPEASEGCPMQLSEVAFRAASWSPPLPGAPPGCLLAVSIAHRTAIYRAPPPLRLEWTRLVDLTPLLGSALSAAQGGQPALGGGLTAPHRATEVHSSSWSAAYAAPAEGGVAGGVVAFLALAGPHLLSVVVHESWGSSDVDDESLHWAVGATLRVGRGANVTCTAFLAPSGAISTPSASLAAPPLPRAGLGLLAGTADGSVCLWTLVYEGGHAGEGGASAGGGRLLASAAAVVLTADWRPVHSLASVDMGCDGDGEDGAAEDGGAAGGAGRRLTVAVGRGCSMRLLSLALTPTGVTDEPGAGAVAAPSLRVATLTEAQHTHHVSAVALTRRCWVSVSVDGTMLAGQQHARDAPGDTPCVLADKSRGTSPHAGAGPPTDAGEEEASMDTSPVDADDASMDTSLVVVEASVVEEEAPYDGSTRPVVLPPPLGAVNAQIADDSKGALRHSGPPDDDKFTPTNT